MGRRHPVTAPRAAALDRAIDRATAVSVIA
jgi:hypothetical protein